MSIKGFNIDGTVHRYDYNSLDNVENINKLLYYPTGNSLYGNISVGSSINNNGGSYTNSARCRTSIQTRYGTTTHRLAVSLTTSTYVFQIGLFNSDGAIGSNGNNGTGWLGWQSTGGWVNNMTVIDPSASMFVLVFKKADDDDNSYVMTDSDAEAIAASIVFYAETDNSLTAPRVPADAKATGDRLGLLEDASLHWEAWAPALYQKSITNDGGIYTSSDNYKVHTWYYLGRSDNNSVRYAVKFESDTYQFRVASYGANGSFGTGGVGTDFNGFINSWGTGTVVLPDDCKKFALMFKKNNSEQCLVGTDGDAIRAGLSIQLATDDTLSSAGRAADAKATGDRLGLLGDRLGTLEGASLLWTAFSPNLSRGRIKNDGSTDPYTARCHTAYLYHGKADSGIKRYKIRFESDTYAMRIAMYGANGTYDGTDFIGYLNSSSDTVNLASGTGTFELPENCKKFGLDFRKAGSESALTTDDYDAIRAGLSVYTNTDTTLSLAGCAADAKAVRDFIAPELTASQKQDILDLVDAYYAIRENVVYNFTTTRNYFASKAQTFDDNNKLKLCCTAFTQLIWGGVDPSTFADPSTYDGTIVKAFDWGYFLKYLIRQRTDGLAIRENGVVTGEYGYRSTNGYEHGWSFNSRYDENGTWPNSQKPRTAMNASDIACELFNNGYEIPLRYADVGDMVFYEEIPSGMNEYYSNAFRRIDHGSIIIGKDRGFFEVAEVTSINGGNPPVLKRSIFSEDDFLAAKSGYMASRIVMVARHPAAFGVAGNVPNKFATVSGRY